MCMLDILDIQFDRTIHLLCWLLFGTWMNYAGNVISFSFILPFFIKNFDPFFKNIYFDDGKKRDYWPFLNTFLCVKHDDDNLTPFSRPKTIFFWILRTSFAATTVSIPWNLISWFDFLKSFKTQQFPVLFVPFFKELSDPCFAFFVASFFGGPS